MTSVIMIIGFILIIGVFGIYAATHRKDDTKSNSRKAKKPSSVNTMDLIFESTLHQDKKMAEKS